MFVCIYNLISGRQRIDSSENTYLTISGIQSLWIHIPSILFGDSFLFLPIDGDNSKLNIFEFGYGPLPFVSESISISKLDLLLSPVEQQFGRAVDQALGKAIFRQFDSAFDAYKVRNHLTDPFINRVNLDIMSYEDIFSIVEGRVIDHFSSKTGDIAKNLKDAYNVLIEARRELLSFTT